ncbi:MAG: Hpt domain-containing protein [Rhodobiaceae bacterium]|nr:Hpt domain-containing protein [Rhodobiaceae bacterium]MCC0055750.1 Hpt domain-containing protein [Rhodobiaceae bacterium]
MRNCLRAAGEAAAPIKPVDLVHLARQTFGDADLEREVLRLFVTQSKLYLVRMMGATTRKQWLESAHTIKGSARGIGAWAVADAAEHAETTSYRKGSSGVASAVTRLQTEVDAANDFIEQLISA